MAKIVLALTGFDVKFEFAEVQVDKLNVDLGYQRPETSLIDLIAANFNPLAFGCVLVGRREGGRMYIVDGQQRTAGARKKGIKRVPAQIFPSEGADMEAELFRYLNEFRKPVGPMDIFRAALKAKADFAVEIDKAVRTAGLKIAIREEKIARAKWPFITAIGTLKMLHGKHGKEELAAALEMVSQCWPDQPESLRASMLRGVSDFRHAFGVTLEPDRVKTRVKVPATTVLSDARKFVSRNKSRGVTAYEYQGVFDALRKLYGKRVPSARTAHPPASNNES